MLKSLVRRFHCSRGHEEFRLDWRHHLGIYPPEPAATAQSTAARAQSPAWGPVEPRGNGAQFGLSQAPPTVSLEVLEELLLRTEGQQVATRSQRPWSKSAHRPASGSSPGLSPDRDLMQIALELTDEEATEARIRWVNEHSQGCIIPSGVARFVAIGHEEAAKRAQMASEG